MNLATSHRSSATTTAVPVPRELEQLDFFLGTWDCRGEAMASDLGGAHAIVSTFEMKRSLGGHWYELLCAEARTEANPTPIVVTNHWGFDAVTARLFRTFHTSRGAWGTATSEGFVGDRLVWVGEMSQANGQRVAFRQTVTRTGNHSLEELFELRIADVWVARGSLACHRRVQ